MSDKVVHEWRSNGKEQGHKMRLVAKQDDWMTLEMADGLDEYCYAGETTLVGMGLELGIELATLANRVKELERDVKTAESTMNCMESNIKQLYKIDFAANILNMKHQDENEITRDDWIRLSKALEFRENSR